VGELLVDHLQQDAFLVYAIERLKSRDLGAKKGLPGSVELAEIIEGNDLLIGLVKVEARVVLDLIHVFRVQHNRGRLGKHELKDCSSLLSVRWLYNATIAGGQDAGFYLTESLRHQLLCRGDEALLRFLVGNLPSASPHQGDIAVRNAVGEVSIKTRHKD
jgi:hypothetical protein